MYELAKFLARRDVPFLLWRVGPVRFRLPTISRYRNIPAVPEGMRTRVRCGQSPYRVQYVHERSESLENLKMTETYVRQRAGAKVTPTK
jgi:hypothetical protein